MTDSHDTTTASAIPRRGFLSGASVVALALPAAAATGLAGVAPASASDPWVRFGAAFFHHRDACDASASDEQADREMDLWRVAQDGLEATRPTTVAGVVAGLKAASAHLYQFHIENHEKVCPGILFVKTVIDGACEALEQGVADHV